MRLFIRYDKSFASRDNMGHPIAVIIIDLILAALLWQLGFSFGTAVLLVLIMEVFFWRRSLEPKG